jgi:hypothetical protein
MANFIENSSRAPELLESSFKTLITPAANFIAKLTTPGTAVVELLGDDEVVYGTFSLDTFNEEVESGLLTALPSKMKFNVTSGASSARFTITVVSKA